MRRKGMKLLEIERKKIERQGFGFSGEEWRQGRKEVRDGGSGSVK